jgi:hypothetical protein
MFVRGLRAFRPQASGMTPQRCLITLRRGVEPARAEVLCHQAVAMAEPCLSATPFWLFFVSTLHGIFARVTVASVGIWSQ